MQLLHCEKSGQKCKSYSDICHCSQFKSTSSKSVSVVGLMTMMADDPEHPDVFLLTDSEHGEKAVVQIPARLFLCGVCMFSRFLREISGLLPLKHASQVDFASIVYVYWISVHFFMSMYY